MPKLLRSELKSIVKECLVEILSEGIGSSNNNVATFKESKQYSKNHSTQKLPKKTKSYLDNINFKTSENKPQTVVRKTNLTDDPVLNELLADTAQTTMKEQIAADSKRRMTEVSRPADAAAMHVSNHEPEDLFGGEAAGKWAKLAFFDQ